MSTFDRGVLGRRIRGGGETGDDRALMADNTCPIIHLRGEESALRTKER